MTLNWLLHSYQRRLLETLYENPLKCFFLSELAKAAGVDPGNTKRYLEKFSSRGIIRTKREGRKIRLCANLENPETRKIFELFEITRTANFLEELGERRILVETFIEQMVESVPDIRLIAFRDTKKGLVDWEITIPVAIVVGSKHDVEAVRSSIQELAGSSGFVHQLKVCVYTSDNLGASWNSCECGCIGFWEDRAILYGENYYWEMIQMQSREDHELRFEEMVQNA